MGALLTAVSLGALAAGSIRLRRRFLPLASGAVAALGALVIGCGLFVAAVEVTGAVGLLRSGWLTVACVVAGALSARLGLASSVGSASKARPAPRARAAALFARLGGWEGLAVLAAVAPVLVLWTARTIPSLRSGMLDEDSLFYHMPYAAHFAQSGSITGLLFPT